jgi:transcription elongation factor GreA
MREIIQTLETELRSLEREFRVELPREISTAVAMGDLRENAEYHAALERQAFVKARIGQLRDRLSVLGSMSLEQIPRDKIGLGSSVKLLDLDTDAELTYELVIPEVSDLAKGLISLASPIGEGLAGHVVGDEIEVVIPSGKKHFEVLELVTIHDKKKKD